jgi:hypothetical protein
MKYYFFLFIFILAQTSFAITIDEAKNLALENSLVLKSSEMQLRALKSESILQGRWQNPQIMGQFGNLDSTTTKGSTLEVSVTQPIPISNKNALKRKISNLALSSQSKQFDYFKTWVKHQAVLSMWRVYVTSELHQHGLERTRRFNLIKKHLLTRPMTSIKQRVEKNVIEAQLMNLEKEQDIKKHNLFLAINDLEYWTGKKIEPKDISLEIPATYSNLRSVNFDFSKNIELEKAKDNLTAADLNVKLTGKERLPDLIIGGGYRQENVSPQNQFAYGIVGLNIPLWDSGYQKNQISKIKLEAEKNNYAELQKKMQLMQKDQIELVNMSLHQVQRFPKKILKSFDKSIEQAELGFKRGVIDVTTFIQAETQSHEIIDQVYVNWQQYLDNLSSLLLLNNEDLKWEI